MSIEQFIDNEVLVSISQDADRFWQGFAALLADYVPRNRALLARRDELQAQIDAWNAPRS